jgi:hypothetical protein
MKITIITINRYTPEIQAHFNFNFSNMSCLAKKERFFLPKMSVIKR